jgi:hypothetical protein
MPTYYAPTQVFDPPLAKLMRDAFLAAWESVKVSGSVDAAPYRSEWARQTLALRIIDMAQVRERDVDRLRDDALAHLAKAKMPASVSPRRDLHQSAPPAREAQST